MLKQLGYLRLILSILMLEALSPHRLYAERSEDLKPNEVETLLPKNAKWLLGGSFGAGYGAYSKTQFTGFIPLHSDMDVGYRSFNLSIEGMLGWPSTKQMIDFGNDQIFSGASVQMLQGFFALGYTIWLGSQVSFAPHIGYALSSISSDNTQNKGRVTEYSRGMLSASLGATYEFPIERTPASKATKLPYQSYFIRFLIGYSATTFEKDGRSFDADLLRIICAVGSHFRSEP